MCFVGPWLHRAAVPLLLTVLFALIGRFQYLQPHLVPGSLFSCLCHCGHHHSPPCPLVLCSPDPDFFAAFCYSSCFTSRQPPSASARRCGLCSSSSSRSSGGGGLLCRLEFWLGPFGCVGLFLLGPAEGSRLRAHCACCCCSVVVRPLLLCWLCRLWRLTVPRQHLPRAPRGEDTLALE